jgi:sugar/nucleoside kinase (ribokinase family)
LAQASATTDLLITAGNFSLDDALNPDGERCAAPGGDALYSAVGAAIWRYPVAPLSRVGADYPVGFMERIAGLGIGIEMIHRVAGPTVHYRITNTDTGERQYEHLTPARRVHELSPHGRDLDAVRRAAWAHVAAMPIDLQVGVIARCRAEGVPYSLDPHEEYIVGHETRLYELIRDAVFMPSELEVGLMFPDLVGDRPPEAMAPEAASRLLELGARAVAIKLGASGCFVADSSHQAALPALPIKVVDSIGAGDAFCGGFLAGYLRTDCLLVGAVCGSASAAHVIKGFGAFHSELPAPETLREQSAFLFGEVEGPSGPGDLLETHFPWLVPRPSLRSLTGKDQTPG